MIESTYRVARWLLYRAGLWSPLVRRVWPRAVVLAYHRVADTALDPFGQAVTPATFARQLQHLRARYRVVSLDALLDDALAGRVHDRTVAVTFDDGYADTLLEAAPIAAALETPFTVFVTVQPVVEETPFWWDELTSLLLRARDGEPPLEVVGAGTFDVSTARSREGSLRQLQQLLRRMPSVERERVLATVRGARARVADADLGRPMTVSELRRLAAMPGVTIGAHTMTHPALSALDEAAQREELGESRRQLETMLGLPVRLLAYPFGKREDMSSTTLRVAEAVGYRAAVTTMGAAVVRSALPYAIPRITVHETSEDGFAYRLREAVMESAG